MNTLSVLQETFREMPVILMQLVGSLAYGASNPKDQDALIVTEGDHNYTNKERRVFIEDSGIDCFVVSCKQYERNLLKGFQEVPTLSFLCAWANHEAARQNYRGLVLYGEPPCKDATIFDHKQLVLTRVLEIGDMNFFSPYVVQVNEKNERVCTKLLCWALWYSYIFDNHSLDITPEQHEIIQRCHDGELPIQYAKELRQHIVSML